VHELCGMMNGITRSAKKRCVYQRTLDMLFMSDPESSPTILRSQGRPELALILDYFNCPIGSDRSAEGAPRNGYRT
jgi:hypothetical protein